MVELRPNTAASWFERGLTRLGAGDVVGAREDMIHATELELRPEWGIRLAELLASGDRKQQALALLDRVERDFPDTSWAQRGRNLRAWINRPAGDPPAPDGGR